MRINPATFDGESVELTIGRQTKRVPAMKNTTSGWIIAIGVEGKYQNGSRWWSCFVRTTPEGKTKIRISPYDSPKRLEKYHVRFATGPFQNPYRKPPKESHMVPEEGTQPESQYH